jgi:hypothetical protein
MLPQAPVYDSPEWAEWKKDAAAFEDHKEGLRKNGIEFMVSTGMQAIPLAWRCTINGKRQLNIALPTAEKIIYTDQPRASYYGEKASQDELVTFKHEYAHTQGMGYGLDDKVYYGILTEERRADLMAGRNDGYLDARGFLDIDFVLLTGVSVRNAIEKAEKGGRADRLFPSMAAIIGLQRTLELALTAPKSYVRDAQPLQKAVNEYLGGINGLEERMYGDNAQAVDERVRAWARNNGEERWENWLRKRRTQEYGNLRFMSDKMLDALAELKSTEQ